VCLSVYIRVCVCVCACLCISLCGFADRPSVVLVCFYTYTMHASVYCVNVGIRARVVLHIDYISSACVFLDSHMAEQGESVCVGGGVRACLCVCVRVNLLWFCSQTSSAVLVSFCMYVCVEGGGGERGGYVFVCVCVCACMKFCFGCSFRL